MNWDVLKWDAMNWDEVKSAAISAGEFAWRGIQDGGPVVYVLLFMLAWCLLIVLIKLFQLRRGAIVKPRLVREVEQMLKDNKLAEAAAFCKQRPSPMTRIMHAGIINYDRSEGEIKERLEEAGRQEIPAIRSHLTTLRSLAAAGPLVGLFGTVIGMISVFSVLSEGGAVDGTALAGGISRALITTAVGLLVAVPSIVFYNDFSRRVTTFVVEIEKNSLHLVELLKRVRVPT